MHHLPSISQWMSKGIQTLQVSIRGSHGRHLSHQAQNLKSFAFAHHLVHGLHGQHLCCHNALQL